MSVLAGERRQVLWNDEPNHEDQPTPSLRGGERRLEIGVPPQGGGAFIPLTPRQPMTAAPYAVHAASAGNMSGAGLALPATPPVKFYRLQKR